MKNSVPVPKNKREDKRRVNISWNSRLVFQIGIIVSCLIVFFILQTSVGSATLSYEKPEDRFLDEMTYITYELDVEKPVPVEPVASKPKPVVVPKVVKPVKSPSYEIDNNPAEKDEVEVPQADVEIPIHNDPAPMATPPSDPEPAAPSSMLNVEFVPVYPGCESLSSNSEKIDCLSSKINVFINRKFRKELLQNMESGQIQRIYVQFKIDKQGYITEVEAKANNERLKNEAQRVIEQLPKMKPGRQGDKTVDVIYTIPIVLQGR